MTYNYTGRVVLVTGSTSGIGEEIAKRLASFGASLVITGRSRVNVARVAAECYRLARVKPLEVVGDITIEEDARRLIQSTIDHFGRLDILVNNAGFCQITSIFDQNSLEAFDSVMRLDVRAAVHLTLLAVPHLEKTKGNVVNISSICALKPLPNFYAYCMAKSAIDSFTKCAALELGPKGIRINAINSGGVRSNFFAAIGFSPDIVAQQEEALRRSSPLGLLGEPRDIADLVSYVASPDAKYVTGSCFVIDGGCLNSSLSLASG